MLIDDSGFSEWVCSHFGVGAYHILRKSLKELVARHLRTTVNDRLDEELLVCRQCFLSSMFLENNQVGSGIGSGVLAESVVWHTQSRHKVGTFYKLHPHERTAGVHHTLGCYESYKSSLAHLVECL